MDGELPNSNILPDLIPLDFAATWLGREVGYAVTEEFLHQLGKSGRCQLESRQIPTGRRVPLRPDVGGLVSGLLRMQGITDAPEFKSVLYIRRVDLEALADNLKANQKSDSLGALGSGAYDLIIGALREMLRDHGYDKDTALITAIQIKTNGKRGASERNLRTALKRGKDALK